MQGPRIAQGIRAVSTTSLRRDILAFLIDRQARRLTPCTVESCTRKPYYLQDFLQSRGVKSVEAATPTHLRQLLFQFGKSHNPGGVHAAFRAMRTFFRWYEAEYEPEHWANPIRKVTAPRMPQKTLEPLSLPHLKAMIASSETRT